MTGIDRDVLITRVLDGEATPEDWAAFRAMAERDPSVWRDLADSQQDRAELACALADAISLADRVEAPIDLHAGEQMGLRLRRAVAWVGWAAAAMLAIGVFGGRIGPGAPSGSTQAGLLNVSSPEDALQLYLDKGQETGSVIGEVPERVLISSAAAPDGRGYDVIYLRQIVERQRVEDFYRVGQNEAGQQVPVPYTRPTGWKQTY